MNALFDDQPIIACSTGLSQNTALAVIRLSGFKSLEVLKPFFSINISKLSPNFATLSKLLEGDRVVDQVMLTFFQGPHSFNGENILEMSVHGNQILVQQILNLFINSKIFRLAKEGEFSYRALVNDKLNLSQVEGLDLLLNASSSSLASSGLDALYGKLNESYLALYDVFLHLKASFELSIDFSEDIGEVEGKELIKNSIKDFNKELEILHDRTSTPLNDLLTPSIVLNGHTNAGKSTFFNFLLKSDRSIVSSERGTTRDFISEYINFFNTSFRIVDTAGLRNTSHNIESEGIKRAIQEGLEAFFKIRLLDIREINSDIFEWSDYDLIIITHCDLVRSLSISIDSSNVILCSLKDNLHPKIYGPIGPKNSGPVGPKNSGPIGPENSGPIGPKNSGPIGPIDSELSLLIENRIISKFNKLFSLNPIAINRHREVISKIYVDFKEFKTLAAQQHDVAILASELSIIEKDIKELIGIITPNDVLSSIFSNFCIGK